MLELSLPVSPHAACSPLGLFLLRHPSLAHTPPRDISSSHLSLCQLCRQRLIPHRVQPLFLLSSLVRLPVQFLRNQPHALPFQRLHNLLLGLLPCLPLRMPLLYARPYLLHQLDVGAHGRRRLAERSFVVRVMSLRVLLESVYEEICVSVQQQVRLLVVSFGCVDLRLGRVSMRHALCR